MYICTTNGKTCIDVQPMERPIKNEIKEHVFSNYVTTAGMETF
jgi:hypothetical protein